MTHAAEFRRYKSLLNRRLTTDWITVDADSSCKRKVSILCLHFCPRHTLWISWAPRCKTTSCLRSNTPLYLAWRCKQLMIYFLYSSRAVQLRHAFWILMAAHSVWRDDASIVHVWCLRTCDWIIVADIFKTKKACRPFLIRHKLWIDAADLYQYILRFSLQSDWIRVAAIWRNAMRRR